MSQVEVDIFIPCLVDQYFPETGFNMVRVLEKAGCKVHYNEQQTCCGMPAYHNGYRKQAREVGEKFIDDFYGFRPIVCPGSACPGMVRNDYVDLFENTVWRTSQKELQMRMFELSEFLVDKLRIENFNAVLRRKAVFQDTCSALHWCGISEQPRKLLQNVAGLELIEIDDREICCGFGGSFSAKFPAAGLELARLKLEKVVNSGADLIISTEPGCMLHLKHCIAKEGFNVEVMHLADVLAFE